MLNIIFEWYDHALKAIKERVRYENLVNMEVLEEIGRLKYVTEDEFLTSYKEIRTKMREEFEKISGWLNGCKRI